MAKRAQHFQCELYFSPVCRGDKSLDYLELCASHLADLADAAGLTQGADRSHVALVPGSELRRAVVGRRFQCDAGMDFPRGLKMVTLTMQYEMYTEQMKKRDKERVERNKLIYPFYSAY